MNDATIVESGAMGRVAYARIAPNEDLVQGVEKLCLVEGFRNAFVRGALGSLVDGCLGTLDGKFIQVKGPAVEIVSLAGEVRSQPDGSLRASLTGVIAGPQPKDHQRPSSGQVRSECRTPSASRSNSPNEMTSNRAR